MNYVSGTLNLSNLLFEWNNTLLWVDGWRDIVPKDWVVFFRLLEEPDFLLLEIDRVVFPNVAGYEVPWSIKENDLVIFLQLFVLFFEHLTLLKVLL